LMGVWKGDPILDAPSQAYMSSSSRAQEGR
jgi:hypothetical protein